MFQEPLERFHQFDHGDVRAVVDELMIGVSGIGPAPRIGESVELRLAYLPARLTKEDVVIGVRIKRRIEIDKIDTGVGKFFPVRKPFQIVAEIQLVHCYTFLSDIGLTVQSMRCQSTKEVRDRVALRAVIVDAWSAPVPSTVRVRRDYEIHVL